MGKRLTGFCGRSHRATTQRLAQDAYKQAAVFFLRVREIGHKTETKTPSFSPKAYSRVAKIVMM